MMCTPMMIFSLGPEPNFIEILCQKPCYVSEFIFAFVMWLSFALTEVSCPILCSQITVLSLFLTSLADVFV